MAFLNEGNNLPTATLHIQYKGVWDAQGLFRTVTKFYSRGKYKFYETGHRSRQPGPFGTEQLQTLVGEREMDEYHKWHVFFRMETFDEHEVEVVKNGEKKKLTKGKLWITINGMLETDYEGKWESNMFSLWLRKFYNMYMIRKRYEALFWDPMWYKGVQALHAEVRKFLDFETKQWSHEFAAGRH